MLNEANGKDLDVTNLRHLALRVGDIASSRAFYEDGLGLRFIGFRPNGDSIDLTDGESNLTLLPYEGPARPRLDEGTEYVHYGFLVDDLAQTLERPVNLGADVVRNDVTPWRRPGAGSGVVWVPSGGLARGRSRCC